MAFIIDRGKKIYTIREYPRDDPLLEFIFDFVIEDDNASKVMYLDENERLYSYAGYFTFSRPSGGGIYEALGEIEYKFTKDGRKLDDNNIQFFGKEYVIIYDRLYTLNFVDELGDDVLGIAVAHCDINAVKNLISKGFNVNVKNNDENTPLHLAVMCDDLEIMQILINSGAEVNAQNKSGDTPLSIAVIRENIGAISILGPDADPLISNQEGINSYCIALWEQRYDIIKAIIITQGINNVILLADPEGYLQSEAILTGQPYRIEIDDIINSEMLTNLAGGCGAELYRKYGPMAQENAISAIKRSIFLMNPLNYME